MKMRHTTTPWEAKEILSHVKDDGTVEISRFVVEGDGDTIYESTCQPISRHEAASNAALISNAPHLLNGLKSILLSELQRHVSLSKAFDIVEMRDELPDGEYPPSLVDAYHAYRDTFLTYENLCKQN